MAKTKKTKKLTASQKAGQWARNQQLRLTQHEDALAALLPTLTRDPNYGAWLRQARGMYPDTSGALLSRGQMRGQAQADVNRIMAPQLAHVHDLYRDRSKAEAEAYTYYTGKLAPTLAGYANQLQSSQAAGVAEQAAGNEAMAQYLQGKGAELSGDLSSAMQGIGAPEATVEGTAGLAGGLAGGTAGQSYALGGAATDLMRGQAQTANIWAGKQPIRTVQKGQEDLLAGQRLLSTQEGEDIAALEAKMPELVQSIYGQISTQDTARRGLKATRAEKIMDFLTGRETSGFNRKAGAAAILNNLIQAEQGSVQDYLSSQASLASTETSAATAAAGNKQPRVEILANVGAGLNKWVQENPYFLPTAPKLPGQGPGPRPAKGHVAEARRRIGAQVNSLLPNATPQERKSLIDNALRSIGMNIAPPKGDGQGTGPQPTVDVGGLPPAIAKLPGVQQGRIPTLAEVYNAIKDAPQYKGLDRANVQNVARGLRQDLIRRADAAAAGR